MLRHIIILNDNSMHNEMQEDGTAKCYNPSKKILGMLKESSSFSSRGEFIFIYISSGKIIFWSSNVFKNTWALDVQVLQMWNP